MAVSHIKSATIADGTNTNLVRPGDWNSVHNFYQTIGGNTAGQSTASGTNMVYGFTNGVTGSLSTAAGVATLWVSGDAPARSLYPYEPGSTVSQTMGAIGVSTGSIFVFPYQLQEAVQFNAMRLHWSASLATTTVAASQSITQQYGLYIQNGASLSRSISSSYSMALSMSSVSGTLSYPSGTATSGYAYGTTTWSATAAAQSLVGSVGQRMVDLHVGASDVTIRPGMYWLALHQRQSTVGGAAGLSTALVANNMFPFNGLAYIGQSSGGQTTNASLGMRPFGVFTSTGSAGHSGTAMLDVLAYSGFANTISNIPVMAFASTA